MTLQEFRDEILGADAHKHTEEEIGMLFALATLFSDFAFKKWGERGGGTETSATMIA